MWAPSKFAGIRARRPAAFQAAAVNWDGSTLATYPANFSGVSNGKKGMLSFWYKNADSSGTHPVNFYYNWATNVYSVLISVAGQINISMANAGGTNILSLSSAITGTLLVPASGWVHVLASWDLTQWAKVYFNGADNTSVSSSFTNDTINYSVLASGNEFLGSDASRSLIGDIADFYFNVADSLDLTNAANVAKFYAGGKPVYLGADGSLPTGTAPLVFLSKAPTEAASTWIVNKGSGGNNISIASGALTNASTSP